MLFEIRPTVPVGRPGLSDRDGRTNEKAPIISRPGYVIQQTTIAAITSLDQGLNATTNAYLQFVLSL